MNSQTPNLTSSSAGQEGSSVPLDQWRGIALLSVLVSHGFFFTGRVGGIGRVGVNLFFFISGLLVFRSLTHSRRPTPLAMVFSFWGRRFRRLYPALVTFLAALVPMVLMLRNGPHVVDRDPGEFFHGLPRALLYAADYTWIGYPITLGHLWSVACEMQFYLLAPLIYLLGGRSRMRRHMVWGTILIAALFGGFVGPFLVPIEANKYHFEIAVWPMMLGFCCEYRKDLFAKIPTAWLHRLVLVSFVAFGSALLIAFLGFQVKLLVIGLGAISFLPCFLAYLEGREIGGAPGRILTWLGERTYSIYLWQQPLTISGYLPPLLHPLGALVSLLPGQLWFRIFEEPFLSSMRAPTRRFLLPRKAVLALLLIAAASLAALLVARQQYAWNLARKIQPAPGTPTRTDPAPRSGTLLLLGDSRIQQWPLEKVGGLTVINRGMAGLTSAELRAAAPSLLAETRPRLVVLQIGINDLKLLGVWPGRRKELCSEVVQNITEVVKVCRATNALVIVTAIWPTGPVSWQRQVVWSNTIERACEEVNAAVAKRLQIEREVSVQDWCGDWWQALSPAERNEYYRDTLHFQPAFYDRASAMLEEVVLDAVRERRGWGAPVLTTPAWPAPPSGRGLRR